MRLYYFFFITTTISCFHDLFIYSRLFFLCWPTQELISCLDVWPYGVCLYFCLDDRWHMEALLAVSAKPGLKRRAGLEASRWRQLIFQSGTGRGGSKELNFLFFCVFWFVCLFLLPLWRCTAVDLLVDVGYERDGWMK
jgi:hypothetical protein